MQHHAPRSRAHLPGPLRRWVPCLLAAVFGMQPCPKGGVVQADALVSTIYVRQDSDHTLVVSPRIRGNKRLGATTVDLTYTADVWTSASIDIRTAATRAITEQRDEIDAAVSHELDAVTLTGGYRYSHENDYESNGGTAGASYDFAGNSATLAASLSLYQDAIGRSGDQGFARNLTTFTSRATFTQVLDPVSLVQVTYEFGRLDGYQAGVYRWVGFGGTGLGCEDASVCLPEHVPDARMRHSVAALFRRALGDDVSLGGNYRFYRDDWGLGSHTASAQLAAYVAEQTLVTLQYRFYTQTEAYFYERRYAQQPGPAGFWTRDRELSPLLNHRAGLSLDQRVPLDPQDATLVIAAGVDGALFEYGNFAGLEQVLALEFTLALGLEL